MATYIILNCIFLAGLALWWIITKPRFNMQGLMVNVVILVVFTAIFDSLIITAGIVDYDYAKTLGIRIGAAPIEDFFYAILAGILIPLVWSTLGNKHEED